MTGGAFGAISDRMRLDGGVDLLEFDVAGWHWPAFNLGRRDRRRGCPDAAERVAGRP